MSEQKISDFDENELNAVRAQLQTRYRKAVEPQQAEVALDLTGTGTSPGIRPAVLKLAPAPTAPSFYQPDQQFGTGRDPYGDLDRCAANLFRMQADHQGELAGASSRKTAKDLN